MPGSPDGEPGQPSPCELLPWDTRHFGRVIAKVRGDELDAARATRVDRWCREHGVECLYLLTDASDAETDRVAAHNGYRVVDVKLTSIHELDGLGPAPWHSPGPISVRLASADDLPALRPIAASSHRASRFYFDGGFGEDRCDKLYVAWIERALREPEFELLVAELDGQPIGYHAIRLPGVDPGRLDLVALHPAHRGNGLSEHLLCSSLRRLKKSGADVVLTSIQARNISSVRAHERIGFVAERAEVWHHKWYRGEGDG